MVELLTSLWAFGVKNYLWGNWFHILDAAVIVAAFVIDVVLHGVVEEVGSLVVVARLWRVFKIVEEFSATGNEELEGLKERIGELEKEVEGLRERDDKGKKGRRRNGHDAEMPV